MSGGPRPEKTVAQKMRENLAHMRARPSEFSREDIDAEISHWKEQLDAESKAERKLSRAEKVAAVGSKLGSGATFGFLDEIVGKDEQRFLQKGLEEENPALAMGAEIVGGLAVPGSFLKVAKNASKLRKVGTVLGEGMIQGGLSGAGNAEGKPAGRLDDIVFGAGAGGAAAGAISGVARGVGAARKAVAMKRGVHTPSLDDLVENISPEGVDAAKVRMGYIRRRGLGDEAKMADVLPDGEGMLRAQRTANKDVAKQIDTDLRQRSTRLADKSTERFSEHTGTSPASDAKGRAERLKKAQDEAGPLYDQSRNEAAAFDVTNAPPDFTTPAVMNRPRIARAIKRVIADDPERFGGDVLSDPRLSHDVFDQAYKDMGEDIRYLNAKVKVKTATASERRSVKRMIRDREHLKQAISVRSQTYPKALDKYAGEIAHRNALDMGAKDTPSDMIPDEMAGLEPATVKDYKQGKAGTLRANTPNPDLGEFARFSDVLAPVANKEKAAVFKATFGEDAYKEYMADILEMAKMQRMKGGAGQSETVDKLIEQMQLGGNPDLMEVASQFMTGGISPRGAVSSAINFVGVDRLLSSKANAQENANYLLQEARPELLDDIIRRGSTARQPRRPALLKPQGFGRDWLPTSDLVKNTAAREVGAVVGRRSP